ncbi:hypothetical protein BZG36_00298 [Bifiguratus adelaidae]|uniref:mRNA 3'-end-processing protein n=1 Tax=Bifiguratus adelaidae TaxID=1938954 RepID=A0A261Y7N3_9FUNG|nr:hypothetical protein BZG36_00298 [Bifiguratus adelaidae]
MATVARPVAPLEAIFRPDFSKVTFDFEPYLKEDLKLDLNGKPKQEDASVCKYYLRGTCFKGAACQFKHTNTREKAVVCKHWLRGLCKKGDHCEFLHEFNLKRMPECWFYSKYGECCNGDECMYLHIDPDSKIKECPWYARGFCKHGPNCRNKHVRRMICINYIAGFCPLGPNCAKGHPKYETPVIEEEEDLGHARFGGPVGPRPGYQGFKNLEEVTCFKCGEKGHYANKCPNGRTGPQ